MKLHTYTSKATRLLAVLCLFSPFLAGQGAPAQKAPKPAPVKVGGGGWGEAKEGLRIGLFLENPGNEFRYGDILTFVVRVWNVGEKDFECTLRALSGNASFTLNGDHLQYEGVNPFGSAMPFRLVPTQEAVIPGGTFKVRLVPVGEKPLPGVAGEDAVAVPLLPGKYTLGCRPPLWMSDPDNLNSARSHYARPNQITFTLLPDGGAKPIRTSRLDLPQPNVLWGDPVNGIQNGISMTPVARTDKTANPRVMFQHWVRNTTDRPFDISYTRAPEYDWYDHVSDAKGTAVSVHPLMMMTGLRAIQHVTLTLKPGEPMVLSKAILQLVPEDGKPMASDYGPRMTARPGVYNISLTQPVGYEGLSILCITPTLNFTLPLR